MTSRDVSRIVNLSYIAADTMANRDLASWDTSRVTNMSHAFLRR